jgi:hypothetical protein
MAILRANITRKSGSAGSFIRRCFAAGLFACLAAISALAQTENIVVTLLPSLTNTTDPDAQKEGYLTVAASGGAGFKEAKSWLYFNASALPADIQEKDFANVQLQLVPKEGAARGMTITVAPTKWSEFYSATFDVAKATTLRSPPLPTNAALMKLRSDSASLTPGSLFQSGVLVAGQRVVPPYIMLLLLPQPNASRRVYYGLNTRDVNNREDINDHPDRLPRLIITYSRKPPPIPTCASEPSALALIQSDGRLADRSSCNFTTPNNPTKNDYVLNQVAADTRTKAPVVYRDRLYVVRKVGAGYRLEELSPLGGVIASVPLNDEVRAGSPMVVDRFGRLRIITNDAILTAQLGPAGQELPASVDKKSFAFGQVPTAVVPGPDGTLYIVKNSIFALNPEVGKLDTNLKVVAPEKLWDVAIQEPDKARITLSPDGRFLYALALFRGSKSRFIAINAQTGKDVELLPGKVNTSGKNVTWVSGMQFDSTAVGQKIPIDVGEKAATCTVQTKTSTSLTCEEDLGTKSGVSWADFPDNLNTFRNPVVGRGLKGVDFVYITGNSGSGATLWGVRNDPVTTPDGALLAQLTGVWKYPLEKNSAVGQPILDPTAPPEGEGLSKKKLYFLQGFLPDVAGKPKLIAVKALDGEKVPETPEPAELPEKMSTEANPVVDSAGNVILWANNALYGFTAEMKRLFTAKPVIPYAPELLFGPGGTLYAAYGPAESVTTVSALIPSFQQSDTGPTSIYSPTHLYVTGGAARQGGKAWTLEARGSVILGKDFSVRMGETLAVKVNVSK